jgi:hypothetical protein
MSGCCYIGTLCDAEIPHGAGAGSCALLIFPNAIMYFIAHYSVGKLDCLSEMPVFRPSEANTFVKY